MLKYITFLCDAITILSYEYILYLCGKKRIDCIQNVAFSLSQENIICSKLFQSLSTNSNFLTIEEMNSLSLFNDNVPYTSHELYNISAIVNSFNNTFQKTLRIHTQKPVKSGMIALVYYGFLDSIPIVLKVKRKHIIERLLDGIDKMSFLIYILSFIPYFNMLRLDELMKKNVTDLLKQLDFTEEVKNTKKMYENFSHTDEIIIPYVYEEYTHHNKNIILMTRLYGKKVHNLSLENRENYSKLIALYSMKCILYDGFYHSDLHAGNIFFIQEQSEYKIGIIDFGLVGSISREKQEKYFNFFEEGAMKHNTRNASDILLKDLTSPLNIYTTMDRYNKQKLLDKMSVIADTLFSYRENIDINIAFDINKILYEYGLHLNDDFCNIQLSLCICGNLCNELCKHNEPYMYYIKEALKEIFCDIL